MSGDSDKPSRLRAFTGVDLASFPLINYKPSRKYYIEENPGTIYKRLCFLSTIVSNDWCSILPTTDHPPPLPHPRLYVDTLT